jgi:hypothetical protein
MLSAYVLDLLSNPVTIRVDEGTNSSRCSNGVNEESHQQSVIVLTTSLLSPIQVRSDFLLERLKDFLVNHVSDNATA